MTVESNQKVIYEMAAWKLRAEVAEEALAAAEARVVAAEAERDALVAALERIERMTDQAIESGRGDKTDVVLAVFDIAYEANRAARPAPAEPPERPTT